MQNPEKGSCSQGCHLCAKEGGMPNPFVFATCRAGSETALKKEVAGRHEGKLTPAFMRPQLITWKAQETELQGDFRLRAWHAQVSGISLGMAKSEQEVAALAAGVTPVAVHVLPREVPEDGIPAEAWSRVDDLRAGVCDALILSPERLPRPGECVLDVIVGAEGEPMLVGWHRHQPEDLADPAALLRLQLPDDAPSRAWLKMEQALRWSGQGGGLDLKGKTVLELGSAPGGASRSLLSRGAEVFGVDTGEMDAGILDDSGFHHLKVAAGDLRPSMVPGQADLIVSDMNLEPWLVGKYVEKFASRLQPRGLILTLKINSGKVAAELPELIQRIRTWAPGPVHIKQLPANRQELTLISWSA